MTYPGEKGKGAASKELIVATQTALRGAWVVKRHVERIEGGACSTGWGKERKRGL